MAVMVGSSGSGSGSSSSSSSSSNNSSSSWPTKVRHSSNDEGRFEIGRRQCIEEGIKDKSRRKKQLRNPANSKRCKIGNAQADKVNRQVIVADK